MTEAQPPTRPGVEPVPTRIGNVERQQAMDALDVHMSAGRLDPDEYGERVGRASVARTTADLEPLFADLPAPHATGTVTTAKTTRMSGRESVTEGSATSTPAWTPPSSPTQPDQQRANGREPLGGRVGEVAVAVSPFVALILFFAAPASFGAAWIVFLLIPMVGAVVYGRDRHGNRHRDRQRNRPQ